MSTHLLPRCKRGLLATAALCSALALTACGGGSSSWSNPNQPPPTGGTPPPAASDSFFDYVLARVGALLDTEEPAAIDAVTETKPEDTEPKPVGP